MAFDDSTLLVPDGETLAPEELEKRQAAAEEEHKRVEKLAASRLFFVRLPKPAELSSTGELDKQKAAIDEKLRKVSDELQPIMADRSKNSSTLAEAREAVRELKAQIEDKEAILNPYQQEKKAEKQDRESQRRTREEERQATRKAREEQHRAELGAKQKIRHDFASQYGHLGVSNDDEIDEKLRELEFRQQHESLTIAEEKAVLKQIKQLQESREAVRAFAQWSAEEKAERDAKAAQAKKRREEKEQAPAQEKAEPRDAEASPEDAQRQEMAELKRVVDGLWEDYKLQMDIRNRHQEIEAGFREKIDALFEKRDALRKERDEVWKKIQKHRDAVRAAHKPFAENRAFSGQVRDLVKQGKADEARARCSQQTEELMEQYASDAAFRAEYNKLWDAAVDYKRPAATASESHHHAAVSVIAEALEAARRSVASRSNKKERPAESKLEPAVATESASLASAAPAAKPATIPGLEDADKPKAKPKKEKKAAKAPPVELPQLDDTPFVPPVAVLEKSAGPSAAELKEQERAHNRAAAAEAAQRKERRRQAQEKKRLKAQQRSEQAQQAVSPQAKEVAAEEEVAAPDTPPVEEVNFKAAAGGPAEGLSAAVSQDSKLRGRGAKVVGKPAPAPKPRPFARKKTWHGSLKQYGRSVYSTVEEYPVVAAGVGGAVALLVTAVPALYYFS